MKRLEPQQAEKLTRLAVNTDFHAFCAIIDDLHSEVMHELPSLEGDSAMKHVGELRAYLKLKRYINDAPKYRSMTNGPA